jgi:site-specific DNA recombinase
MLLGAQSKREVLRARSRALAAMRAQIRDEGRFLDGRPLYGYRLMDAGPHPNRCTRSGVGGCSAMTRTRRLRRPSGGSSRNDWPGAAWSAIAANLDANGVPNPSQADLQRNRHRTGRDRAADSGGPHGPISRRGSRHGPPSP